MQVATAGTDRPPPPARAAIEQARGPGFNTRLDPRCGSSPGSRRHMARRNRCLDPNCQGTSLGRQTDGQPAREGLEGGAVQFVHTNQNRNLHRHRVGNHIAKPPPLCFMLTELVDDHQIGAPVEPARDQPDSGFKRCGVQPASPRRRSEVLSDPKPRTTRQNGHIHVAGPCTAPLGIDLNGAATA